MKSPCMVAVISIWPGALLLATANPLAGQAGNGYPSNLRLTPKRTLNWVNSGAWSADGTLLYLADVVGKEIVPFALDGTAREDLKLTAADLGLVFSTLQATEEGFIVEGEQPDGTMLFFESLPSPKPDRVVHLVIEGPNARPKERLGAVHSWTYSNNRFYTFSDIEQDRPAWTSAFLSISPDSPEEFEAVLNLRLSTGDPLRLFYRLGLSLFTSDERNTYILVMDDHPYIFEPRKGTTIALLGLVPPHCAVRPTTPPTSDPKDYVRVLNALEESNGPAGIYAWNNSIYLLCRKANPADVSWSLIRIDPGSGALVSMKNLDIGARNLTVIPGPLFWAFIEKGPVELVNGLPYMEIDYISLKQSVSIDSSSVPSEPQGTPTAATAPKEGIIGYISANRTWIFSGIGLPLIGVAVALVIAFTKRGRQILALLLLHFRSRRTQTKLLERPRDPAA